MVNNSMYQYSYDGSQIQKYIYAKYKCELYTDMLQRCSTPVVHNTQINKIINERRFLVGALNWTFYLNKSMK